MPPFLDFEYNIIYFIQRAKAGNVKSVRSVLNPTYDLIHPKYWLNWVGIALLSTVCLLPRGSRTTFGSLIGLLAFVIAKRRREIVEKNLRVCFPNLPDKEVKKKIIRNFRSSGTAILETFEAWAFPQRDFESLVEFEGLELLVEAKKRGKGVLLVGNHLCSLDLCGAALSRKIPFHVMYKRNKNLLINTIMNRGRTRNFESIVERKNIRRVIRILREGSIIWYGPDQDFGEKNSVFVPFFGFPTATITATSRIAQSTNASVIFMSQYRKEKGRYFVKLSGTSGDFPSNDISADCEIINKKIEEAILLAPDQYWWLHRRFKTRPPGEEKIY